MMRYNVWTILQAHMIIDSRQRRKHDLPRESSPLYSVSHEFIENGICRLVLILGRGEVVAEASCDEGIAQHSNALHGATDNKISLKDVRHQVVLAETSKHQGV